MVRKEKQLEYSVVSHNYFKKVGLIRDSVVIWTPINIFAHINRKKVKLLPSAYELKLKKILTTLDPGMISFDPVQQVMIVKAPYMGQALAAIYLIMKMTAAEITYNPVVNKEMMENFALGTIPGHSKYNHLTEIRLESYIRNYILTYC